MREFIKTHTIAVIALMLVMPTLWVYWPVLNHGFITYYDDGEYVTENPHVQAGLTGETVRWAFTTMHSANWHPLTWISHAADCQLYGLNPEGHHLTNLMLHAANVFLLFLVLSLMTGYRWRSAFVAALFAVHPLHVESVAWIAERKDLLSTFFWLLTMLAYMHYSRRPGIGRYLPVVIAFALGLLSKPMLVTLPLVLILLDYWPLKRDVRWTKLVLEKIPLLLLSAASCVITIIAQAQRGAVASLEEFTPAVRVANALVGYASYMWKMFWPARLALIYPHPGASLPIWKAAVSALLLIAITIVVISARRKRPYLAVGWLWFLVTLVPVIGLIQVGGQAIADRYTYVPLIGLFIIVVWLASEIKSVAAPALGIVVLLSLMIATRAQVGYWQSSTTLFEHTLKCTSRNYVAEDCLGHTLADEGEFGEAAIHYRSALRIDPKYAPAHNNLGIVLANEGRIDEGIVQCREALRLDPGFAAAHYNLGKALDLRGDVKGAIAEYGRALQIRPDDSGSLNNLGNIYAREGKLRKAEDEFRAALNADPGMVEAHNSLSSLLHQQGRLDEAAQESRVAIALDPSSAAAHYNLGVVLQDQDRLDEAIVEYQQAVGLQIDLAPAYYNMAVILYYKGDYAQAWKEVELCQKYGGNANQEFLRLLSEKMPPPG